MSSTSRSFNDSAEENENSDKDFSSKDEEYDLNLLNKLIESISEILKEIISSEENKDKKSKGKNVNKI